jgi:uncharacterized protein DUF4241
MIREIFSRLFRRAPSSKWHLPISAEYLSLALEDGRKIVDKQFGALTLRHHRIAELQLPTGMLVAGDPFTLPDGQPYRMPLPRGAFPVFLSVAEYDSDQRVAFAIIQFQDRAPTTWKMMATANQDPAKLKPGHHFGYPVDSGTGCFMDETTGEAFIQKLREDENFSDVMMAEMEKNYRHTWDWMDMKFGDLNVVAFKTGFGDGIYTTHAGFDSENNVVAVVTDFIVAPTEEDTVPQH